PASGAPAQIAPSRHALPHRRTYPETGRPAGARLLESGLPPSYGLVAGRRASCALAQSAPSDRAARWAPAPRAPATPGNDEAVPAHWYSVARIAPRLYVPSGVQSRGGSLVGPVRPELAPLFTEGLPRRTIPVLSMTKKRRTARCPHTRDDRT